MPGWLSLRGLREEIAEAAVMKRRVVKAVLDALNATVIRETYKRGEYVIPGMVRYRYTLKKKTAREATQNAFWQSGQNIC